LAASAEQLRVELLSELDRVLDAGHCAPVLLPWLRRTDWATLGWYEWVRGVRPNLGFDYGRSTTEEANRQLAALIGLARLARLAGDEAWEERAMVHAALALTHRFALGKYVAWLAGQKDILSYPEGYSAADDIRMVAMSEKIAYIGYSSTSRGPGLLRANDTEGPYAEMAPELGRFLADFLRPEAEAFARKLDTFYGDALMTLGTPRRKTEWWHNNPIDTRQVFLMHTWVLGKDPAWLQRRVDVPLTPVADWYHIDKLVATLHAYAETGWMPFPDTKR
jgi:hypothetical protein